MTIDRSALRTKAAAELREFAALSLYLWICFGAVLVLKSAILQAHGITYLPWGFALVKALVSAKFIMIGHVVLARNRSNERLIVTIARKTFALLVLLAVLTVAEEAVLAAIHGRPEAQALADVGGGTAYQMAATVFVLLLILVPYVAARSIDDALGPGSLRRLLLDRRETTYTSSTKAAG